MPKVSVKWGRERYEVNADLDMEPLIFKSQLFELTGVVPSRQKVVYKGKTLPDEDWGNIKLNEGDLLMLLGTIGEIPTQPSAETIAALQNEDASDPSESKLLLPAGLTNLGNTCYLNATLQVLRTINELQEACDNYAPPPVITNEVKVTAGVKTLFSIMARSDNKAVTPSIFVQLLRSVFPQFASKDERGMSEQQDANECFTLILQALFDQLKLSSDVSFKQFMSGTHEVVLKNTEDESEVQTSEEHFHELSCFLTSEVKYLQLGIGKTSEHVTKNSPKLGRDAIFEKTTLISRLPAYLSICEVRFFYKENKNISAKILKDVKFPVILDVLQLCTPALKEKLAPMRARFKEFDDKMVDIMAQAKISGEKDPLKDKPFAPFSFEDDPGSNNSGFYELQGIITHKGRSSNSGHYVGWARTKDNGWVMCNDDEVQPVSEDDVLRLSGGGDWHIAYILLYGPRRLRVL